MPPPPGGLGAGIFPFIGVPVAFPGLVGAPPSTSQSGRRHPEGRVAAVTPAGRWLRPVGSARVLGSTGRAATGERSLPAPHRLPADRRAPQPAHPPVVPIPAAPLIGSPVTGGGPAAAGAGTGGGAAAASLMAVAALLLLFTLSIPVSLDMSAWRSTLLSLRLERPG